MWVQKLFKNPPIPCVERGLPTNTHVSKTWVSNVGILPENKTHVLKTWVFLETMKPTFRGGMKGGSNLFILFRKAQKNSHTCSIVQFDKVIS